MSSSSSYYLSLKIDSFYFFSSTWCSKLIRTHFPFIEFIVSFFSLKGENLCRFTKLMKNHNLLPSYFPYFHHNFSFRKPIFGYFYPLRYVDTVTFRFLSMKFVGTLLSWKNCFLKTILHYTSKEHLIKSGSDPDSPP